MGFYEDRPPRHGHRSPSEIAEDETLSSLHGRFCAIPAPMDQAGPASRSQCLSSANVPVRPWAEAHPLDIAPVTYAQHDIADHREDETMYKAIMVPTEGSDSETAAVSVATRLAQRFDAALHFVRVQSAPFRMEPISSAPSLFVEQTFRAERLAALRNLESLAAECGRGVFTALEDGPVGPTLRDYAEKLDIDLIVMSSHARSGIRRVILGSVTDFLIRHTNIPVLVVKESASPRGIAPEVPIGRIVVPLDGSVFAQQILSEVAYLASRLRSTVTLLHVLTPATYSQDQIMQPGLPWWDADIAAANAYLADAAKSLIEEGFAVATDVIISDDVSAAILDYSTRSRADLIAIATRGIGGMSRSIFGTVADEVTRKSACSVLVCHPKWVTASDERPKGQAAPAVAEV